MTSAAAEVTTPEEQTVPAETTPEAVTTPDEIAPSPEGEQAAPDVVETTAEFKPEDARRAAVAEAFGTPPDSEGTTPEQEMPGQSLDDVAASLQIQHDREYAGIMQTFEQNEIQPYLREELGLEPAEAQALYQKVRPWMAGLHTRNEAHNLEVTDTLLRSVLTPEEVEEYSARSYVKRDAQGRVLPLASRSEAFKAVLTLREKKVNADWQAKVEKGEYLTKAEAQKKADAAITKYEKTLTDAGRLLGTSSGAVANGGAGAAGVDISTKAKARTAHANNQITDAQMRAIRDNPSIPEGY